MKKITAYHNEIAIQKEDGGTAIVKVDLNDYHPDIEIMKMLANLTGSNTAGEIVRKLESSDKHDAVSFARILDLPILSIKIENGRNWQFGYDMLV